MVQRKGRGNGNGASEQASGIERFVASDDVAVKNARMGLPSPRHGARKTVRMAGRALTAPRAR